MTKEEQKEFMKWVKKSPSKTKYMHVLNEIQKITQGTDVSPKRIFETMSLEGMKSLIMVYHEL
jgi:hypothetical protein